MTDWSLVVPFVVVQSTGGPYDDYSFAAGYTCGRIQESLEKGWLITKPQLVHRAVLPQLDLIAMKTGYVVQHEDVEPTEEFAEWVRVTFVKESGGT